MADEVNSRFGRFRIEVDMKCFESLEVDQAAVAMIRGKVKVREKVGTNDWLFDVGDYEFEWVILATQLDSMSNATVTRDCGAICGRKFGPVRTFLALGGKRREDGEHCPPVDEPFEFGIRVLYIQEVSGLFFAGRGGVHFRRPAVPFPVGAEFCCDLALYWQPGSQL